MVKCKCGNFTIDQEWRVLQGGLCQETPSCKEMSQAKRWLEMSRAREYAQAKAARKAAKNARRQGNLAARRKESQDHASSHPKGMASQKGRR